MWNGFSKQKTRGLGFRFGLVKARVSVADKKYHAILNTDILHGGEAYSLEALQ